MTVRLRLVQACGKELDKAQQSPNMQVFVRMAWGCGDGAEELQGTKTGAKKALQGGEMQPMCSTCARHALEMAVKNGWCKL